MACSWSAAFCGHEHGGVSVVARIVPAHRPFLPRDVCRPRFDVATFIANEDSLDCRGLRRGEGLRLLRWPTAPSSSMGSIRFRSGGAAREAAAGTLGSIRSFPSVAPKARIWRTFLAQIYDVLAPAEGLRPTSPDLCTVFGFCYLFVWGYIADLSMVPRLRRGRLAGRALSHPFILRGQKSEQEEGPRGGRAPLGVGVRRPCAERGVPSGDVSEECVCVVVLVSGVY